MARITFDGLDGQPGENTDTPTILKAEGQDSLQLPSNQFIANSEMTRDGMDLVLEAPNGDTVIVEGYFTGNAPTLTSPEGNTLTPKLVSSFVQHSGEYAQNASASDESPVGEIQEISGTATVTRADGTTEPLSLGMPIYQGDIVETAADGAVNIVFSDESSFAVSESAKLAVDEYVFDPASQSGETDVSVLRGVFVFTSGLIGRDDPDDVNIETPVGSIGIRGTTIAGNIDPDGESQITVVEGAIVVRNENGEVTLSEQFETVKINSGAMENIGALNQEQLSNDYSTLKPVAGDFFSGIESRDPANNNADGDANQPTVDLDAGEDGDALNEIKADDSETQSEQEGDAAQDPAAATEGEAESEGETELEVMPEDSTDSFGDDGAFNDKPAFETQTQTTDASATAGTAAPAPALTQTSAPAPAPVGTPRTTTTTDLPPQFLQNPDRTITNTGSSGGGSLTDGGGAVSPPPSPPPIPGLAIAGGNAAHEVISFSGTTAGERMGMQLFASEARGFTMVSGNGTYHHITTATLDPASAVPYASGQETVLVSNGTDSDPAPLLIMATPQANGGEGGIYIGSKAITGFTAGDMAGSSLATADINGDGYQDIIFGASGAYSNKGSVYVIFGNVDGFHTGIDASLNSDLTGAVDFVDNGEGMIITSTGAGDRFGMDMVSAGDFNQDGYEDFLVSRPGESMVHLVFGSSNFGAFNLTTDTTKFMNVAEDDYSGRIPVFNLGDTNGDGRTDLAIADTMENKIHIIYGNNSYGAGGTVDLDSGAGRIGYSLSVNPAFGQITGGGSAGDFNGDGYDDFALAITQADGKNAFIYIKYGDDVNLTGDINLDLTMMQDTSKGFLMNYKIDTANPDFEFSIASAGDLDGDGFDDLAIGTPDAYGNRGELLIVNGRPNAELLAVANPDMHAAGINGPANVVASSDGDALVGDASGNTLSNQNAGTSYNKISFNGGGGNDNINIFTNHIGPTSGAARNIDGGDGIDYLNITNSMAAASSIDFTHLGTENFTGIEKIVLNNTASSLTQSVTIGIDQIFHLLHTSDNGELWIGKEGVGITQLNIDNNDGGYWPDTLTANASAMGLVYQSTTDAGGGNYYTQYNVGDYKLYIETNITATVV